MDAGEEQQQRWRQVACRLWALFVVVVVLAGAAERTEPAAVVGVFAVVVVVGVVVVGTYLLTGLFAGIGCW